MKISARTVLDMARAKSRQRYVALCALTALAFALGGCSTAPSRATPNAVPDIASGQAGAQGWDANAVDMAAQYHILAGEMAAQRGMTKAAVQHYIAALKFTHNKELARRATRIALFAGDPEPAYQAAREWARLAPGSLDAQRSAARLALIVGDAEALFDYSRAVVATAVTRVDGYQLLADVLSGKPERADMAVDTLARLVQENNDSSAAWYALGVVALRYDHVDTAADAAQQAAALAPDWVQAALLQAAIAIRTGQPARAQTLVEGLPGSAAQRSDHHLTLARLLLDGSQPRVALDEFERALALEPNNVMARYGLAVLALSLGDLDRAEKAFERLYQADERPDDAAYYLGSIYERREAYAMAERWYQRVDGGGHVFAAKVRAARMRARQGDLAVARDQLHQLRSRYPEMTDRLYTAEGQMLFAAGRYQDALAIYDKGLAEAPDNADLLYGRSFAYVKLGRTQAGLADLQQVLEAHPNSARALNALGYLLTTHSDRHQEALQYISKALAAEPDNPAILDSMGWVQYHLGHLNEALDYLQRAYESFPDAEVAAHLGEVLWQLGRHAEARQVWQQALADSPGHELLTKTIARLTSQ